MIGNGTLSQVFLQQKLCTNMIICSTGIFLNGPSYQYGRCNYQQRHNGLHQDKLQREDSGHKIVILTQYLHICVV